MLIKKYSYKVAIVIGIALFAGGSLLFYPASLAGSYMPFLCCIFIMAIGAGMLEMSCGTYVVMMGSPKESTLRSSIAQTINPIGNIVGIALGKFLIFAEATRLSDRMSGLSESELHAFRLGELRQTIIPYMIIAGILLVLLVMIAVQKYPSCKAENTSTEKTPGTLESVEHCLKIRNLSLAGLHNSVESGAQLTIWSFLIRQVLEINTSMTELSGNELYDDFLCSVLCRKIPGITASEEGHDGVQSVKCIPYNCNCCNDSDNVWTWKSANLYAFSCEFGIGANLSSIVCNKRSECRAEIY